MSTALAQNADLLDTTQFLGSATLSVRGQTTALRPTRACGIDKMQLRFTQNRTRVDSVQVQYSNGQRDQLVLKADFAQGQTSQWINLRNGNVCISAIYLQGQSKNMNGRNSRVDFSGSMESQNSRRRLLGSTRLSMLPDRDVVAVNDCSLSQIQLAVRNGSATIYSVIVRYANRSSETLTVRSNFRNGSVSRWISLAGRNQRCITSIALAGRSTLGSDAIADIYGR
jgi:hypothetical protein